MDRIVASLSQHEEEQQQRLGSGSNNTGDDDDFSYYMENDDDDNDNDNEDRVSLLPPRKKSSNSSSKRKKTGSVLVPGDNPSFDSVTTSATSAATSTAAAAANTTSTVTMMSSAVLRGGQGGDDDELENTKEAMVQKRIARRKKIILIAMCTAELLACSVYSSMASFYSKAAKKKDVSELVVGLIFAAFSFCIFIVSPLTGVWMSRLGRKKLLLIGIVLESLTTLAFAFGDNLDDKTSFVALSFTLRSLAGIGNALIITAAMAISILEFPDNRGMIIGIGELSQGIGLLASPPIGGFLFDSGGFKAPFLFFGGLLGSLFPVILALRLSSTEEVGESGIIGVVVKSSELKDVHDPLAKFNSVNDTGSALGDASVNSDSLPNSREPSQYLRPQPTLKKMLMLPRLWLALLSLFLTISGVTFFEPTLPDYFGPPEMFDYSSGIIGLMFLAISGTYALLAPVVGNLVDSKRITLPFMAFGCLLASVCYFLVGPSPALSFVPSKQEWLVWVVMIVLGFSMAFIVVPTGPEIVAVCDRFDQGERLSDLVSGLLTSAASLGQAIGPLLGGSIVPEIGFPWGASVFAIALAVFGVIHLVTILVTSVRNARLRRELGDTSGARQRLLDD